jgi:hypothetical protein
MNSSDIWTAVCNDERNGMMLRSACAMLMTVPAAALIDAVKRIEIETTVGPITNPSAYLDGRRFDNAKEWVRLLEAAIQLRQALSAHMLV